MPAPTTEEGRARSLANLRPIKKGEVLNPTGRRGKLSMLDLIRQEMQKPYDVNDPAGKTHAQHIAQEIVHIAGDRGNKAQMEAIKLLMNYFEGQPTKPMKLEIRRAARLIAEETGADVDWLVNEAEEIVRKMFDRGELDVEGEEIP